MKKSLFVAISLLLFDIGCTSPTAPDKNCHTLKREEIHQTITNEGRLIFITVIAPEMTICE